MNVTRAKIRLNWIILIGILTMGLLAMSVYLLATGIDNVKVSSKRFETFILNGMKSDVRSEVLNRVDEIEYELRFIQDRENEVTKSKVQNMRDMLLNELEFKNVDISEMKSKVLEEFEIHVSVDTEYFFFALSKEGELLRSGTDSTFEGTSVVDLVDKNGVYYIREMLKAVDNPDGVYVTYDWPKVSGGEPLTKTSYCLYAPELDILIGTGSYLEDMEIDLKSNITKRLQFYYSGKNSYIFIHENDGTALVSGNSSYLGENMSQILDYDGVSIHDKCLEALKDSEDAFITYYYLNKETGSVSEKISYIKRIDQWDAYIGMGFYTDDLVQEIERYNEEFKKDHYRKTSVAISLLVVSYIALFLLIRRATSLQGNYLKQEDVIFEQLFQLSNDGILILSDSGEILYENRKINLLFNNNIEDYVNGSKLTLKSENEKVYRIENSLDRTYFIEISQEPIGFKGYDSLIYFFKDVTKAYLKSNKFEQLALIDELTQLPNRRKLVSDFDELSSIDPSEHEICVGIVDLDDFKKVNDVFGHTLGDEVLKLLGDVFKHRLRPEDTIYRYGGEEFVVILKNTSLKNAKAVLTEINKTLGIESEKQFSVKVTYSGGLVSYRGDSLYDTIKSADFKLYQAKRNGKNRIEI
ncbi:MULTISPECIES: cache domain-containing protein [unclassified Fusibacter]|uniref:sensor domain-containing diguanylate cyclase n=1 Tax=unclassified Fusibacter TaxID=2624464 RepID=UPI00101193DB|nr:MULTISPECIES: cache domain-containing protein [unclassified Fusibacter]MCK8058536.1 cache domain-containing protein [Fusibacter sp. A2]NPE22695.1 diguanylate cyclase [Fusibacter sp. A1]RXV60255.1 diguanylate cyclase [Fusibacter sp. A1]